MSLKRQLLLSFGVQGAGAASVLLATLWLGSQFGPVVQGGFSRSKSEIEFVAALAMFGLPQALFFHVKSGGLSGRRALRWAAWTALLALPIGAGYALLARSGPPWGVVLGLGVAVAAGVAHGQLRALLLVQQRTVWFNGVTALPQLLVLAGVAWLVVGGFSWDSSGSLGTSGSSGSSGSTAWRWPLLFALAYAVSAAVATWRLRAAPEAARESRVGWRQLGHYGLAAWLTAVLSTAAILALQRWVEAEDGAAALGRFTLALSLMQVPLTPIAYAAPLLLRRWMEQPGAQDSRRWAGALFALLLVLAALVWALAGVWPALWLGPAYQGTAQALALLLAGGAAEAASRVLTVQASASGLPWVGVRAEATRWAVLAAGWWLPLPPGLLPKCALWAGAAGAAALVFAWHAAKASRAGQTGDAAALTPGAGGER